MEGSAIAQVKLGDRLVAVDALYRSLGERDSAETTLIVAALRDPATADDALYAIVMCMKRPVQGVLRHNWLQDEDSVNEAWTDCLVRVHRRISSFDPLRSSFKTWVFNEAKYAALDLRRRDAQERLQDRATERATPRVETWDDDIEPLTPRERAGLSRAQRRLTRTERALLDMKYVEGMSYGEIAEATGVENRDTLRVAVFRAARKLDRMYREELG